MLQRYLAAEDKADQTLQKAIGSFQEHQRSQNTVWKKVGEVCLTALETAHGWLSENDLPERVVFVLFNEEDLKLYQQTIEERQR